MRFALSSLAALSLGLAACADGGATPADEAPAGEAGEVTPLPMATLDLQATGLIIPAQSGFEQFDVPFGSTRAATETTLARIVGEVVEKSASDECPVGPVMTTRYEGLTLTFQQDKLVGYMASEPYVPQLTRAEMLLDPTVQLLEDSTLGEEFTIGDPQGEAISGLFSGPEDGATVERLWAGANCIYR